MKAVWALALMFVLTGAGMSQELFDPAFEEPLRHHCQLPIQTISGGTPIYIPGKQPAQ